ncbi:methyltransferase family protein [Leptolyngbya sp. PCC 7375]|nr:methyltransferase family protein [Leptolyngbya sp. PCC 7375]
MSSFNCAVCHGDNHKLLHSLEDGTLLSCQFCGVVAFFPRPTCEELKAFYDGGYHDTFSKSVMAESIFAQHRYQALVKKMHCYAPDLMTKKKRTLLDVGCGTGDFLQVVQQAGWHVTGTELALDAVNRANQKVSGNVFQGDITDLALPCCSYDLVTSYHVIEHLLEPIAQLRRCYELLASGGLLFLETPNIGSLGARLRGKRWSHIIPPEHIIYFSPFSLKYALNQAGFEHFVVYTTAPQVIESTAHWPFPLKKMADFIYQIVPHIGLGAAVQAIAFKP